MSHIDRYSCEDLIRRLDDYLDRRLTDDEARLVEEHLALCAICTMEYNFEAAIIEDLKRKIHRIEAPPDLFSKISKALREEDQKKKPE